MLAGAKPHLTNTVGRTAAQMAAFVGMCWYMRENSETYVEIN